MESHDMKLKTTKRRSKIMKKALSFFSICIILLLATACTSISDDTNNRSVLKEKSDITTDFSSATTIGNNTYIPINKSGSPDEFVWEILGIIQNFEKEHPDLKVENWKIEKNQHAYTTSAYIMGLWIQHSPKNPSELKTD